MDAVLLADVLESPLLDRARLAVALELEDEDPARATLIRLQIGLAHGTADADAEAQIGTLLETHSARWCAELEAQGARGHLLRGFIEEVEAPAEAWLAHGTAWFERYPVQLARVTHRTGALPDLLALPFWSRVRGLDLAGLDLDDEDARALAAADLSGLVWLRLENNPRLGLNGVLALSRSLPQLRWMALRGTACEATPSPGGKTGLIAFWETSPAWSAVRDAIGVQTWMTCDVRDRAQYPPAWWQLLDVGTDLPGGDRPTLALADVVQQVLAQAMPTSQILLVDGAYRGGQRPRRRVAILSVRHGVPTVLVDAWVNQPEVARLQEALFTTYDVLAASWDARGDDPWTRLWCTDPAPFTLWSPSGPMIWLDDTVLHRRDGPLELAECVEVWVSRSWVARGIRLRHETTVTHLVMVEDTATEADPTYDKVDLDADVAWLLALGQDLATALGVPFVDLVDAVCDPDISGPAR